MLVDHAPAARVVAELGRVGDRPAHPCETTLVHQVDDQLQLVEALVVGDLGLVTGLDERLEPGPHELGRPSAENGLLAEEIRLRLLLERRLEDPGAPGADAGRVRERELAGPAARVALDCDQRGCAVALREQAPDDVTRPLRRDHDHVVARPGATRP